MLRNKRFLGFLLILCLILIPMSIYQHAGSDVVEQNAPWYEFLGWFLEGSFNKPEHHGFLFLAMELLLLLQILPEVNEQRLVRMSRREHWRKTWAAMGISAFAFSTLFSLIHFFMTLIFIDPTVMLRSGFATVSVLFFIRIFCVYMVENGVFGILYVILLRKEVAAALCTVFFMVIFYWVYERLNWGSDEGIWQTLNLMKDLRVYSAFYSEGGLDLFAYGLATVKHLLWMGLLYLGSLWIFEKRDILNGKK